MGSKVIPFGAWMPDQPPLGNPGALEAKGVIPSPTGYRPFPSIGTVGSAFTNAIVGALPVKTTSAVAQLFMGDASKLWRRVGNAWEDASGAAYTGSTFWRGVQFGSTAILTNYNDPIQAISVDSATGANFADLAAAAPRARFLTIWKDFLVAGGTYDASDGDRPSRVWWSAINDPTDWPTPASTDAANKQSDYQDVPDGYRVMGLTSAVGGTDGAVFMQSAIYRVQYEGPPTVFGFYKVENASGCIAENSIVNVGDSCFYLGEDGFYEFNGAQSSPIGNEIVDRWFADKVDTSRYSEISGSADIFNKVVVWNAYDSFNQPFQLVYHWPSRRWAWGDQALSLVFPSYSPGYTLEDLDAVATLDALPYSLDSRAWVGGRLLLSGVTTAKFFGSFGGSAVEATIDTGEMNIPGWRVFVQGVRPLVEGAEASVTLLHRDSLSASTSSVGPVAQGVTGSCPFRKDVRYARARITIAAGETWSHATGAEVDFTQRGRR